MSTQVGPTEDEGLDRDLTGEVRELLGQERLQEALELLGEAQPADVADVLESLPEEQASHLFKRLGAEHAAEVLSEIQEEGAHDIAEAAPEAVYRAAREMEPDELADLLEALSHEQREALLGRLPREEARNVRQLYVYPPDTAGGIMTTDFVLLREGMTAEEAVRLTQSSRESETIAHLFVSDEDDRLLGHLPLQRLVFAAPQRNISTLMEPEVATVTPETDQEEVVRLATRYGMDVVAVVDRLDRMMGVITTDDILEAGQEEADEDIYRLAGTGERHPVTATVMRSTRLRLPWLLLTLVGGLGIAFVVSRFGNTVRTGQIAFFIPLIPLMGGNVAIQSSAIVVRGLAVGEIYSGRFTVFVLKQWLVTVLLALCCGAAAAGLGHLLPQVTVQIRLVVGAAVAAAIVVAGTLGTLLPLAFDRLGLDPAVSAGPFVTILNDITCIAIYLSLGTLLA